MVDSGIGLSLNTPLGAEALALRAVSGEERISRPFHYRLELDSQQSELDFGVVVGQPATVTIEPAAGGRRHIDGVIARFVQEGRTEEGRVVYRADLHPSLWLLGLSSNCRVFQETSAPEIVEALLAEHGIDDYELRLSGSYRPRTYSVQYNESDLDLISRLLEEEGIFYFFEHREGGHTLVLGDDGASFAPPAGEPLRYGEALAACALEEVVIPASAALDDFNFETPSTDLEVDVDSAAARGQGRRRLFEYPGGFTRKSHGEEVAGIRMQERETPRLTLRGESAATGLASGHRFTLEDHYRYDVNGDYVAEWVSFGVDGDGLRTTFRALPASVTYRPPRATPRPVIAGTQTAIVVGPSGEEIWTDRYGRVKVQFHWDRMGRRDETSSCWVRVSHAWAGRGWGQLFLPRVGQEVIVGFEEGDPDRPVIIGRLYNAEQVPPADLPGERTRSVISSRSSKGGSSGNELRFEDATGSEEVLLRAQRDLWLAVESDEVAQVGGDRWLTIGRDQTSSVGNDQTRTIGHDQTTTVGGERAAVVAGGDSLAVGGALTLEARDGLLRGVRRLELTAGESITIRVGRSRLIVTEESIRLAAPKIELSASHGLELESGGSAILHGGKSAQVRARSSLRLESGGDLTVKGALVKIN